MPRLGTRSISRFRQGHPPGGSLNAVATGDLGMTKRVTASITFGGGNATGANGTFANTFAAGDPIEIVGSNLNSGFFTVNGLDATNNAFLTLDPPPKAEGPITVTIRTV